jgi:microsomal dipeptidase-like Zn-dependent dipeptidase
MLADLHAHYPMRVVENLDPWTAEERMRRPSRKRTFADNVRASILWVASRLFSNRHWWSDYRITVDGLRKGGVGLAMSVLYQPFEEIDLDKGYAAPPDDAYFSKLMQDLEAVEQEVATHDRSVIRVVRNRGELDQAIGDRAAALVHCVEGGFHLGDETHQIERNVATLASRGVAYVTLAHLFFRQVATNAPALPFLPTDAAYRLLFPQPAGEGLTPRGKAAVRAMVNNRVMVDVSHMRPATVKEVVRLLDDELDPNCEFPLVATHGGYRFGRQEYMLDEGHCA